MSRICDICNGMVHPLDQWIYQLTDKEQRVEIVGHKHCIDDFQARYRAIKNYSTKLVSQCLNELNYEKE